MLKRPDLAAARERMQNTAATALGLVAIVLLFVYLVPRQGEIADAMNARRAEASADADAGRIIPEARTEAAAAPEAEPAIPPGAATPEVSPPAPVEAVEAEALPTSPSADRASQLLARPVVLDTATILVRQGRLHLAGVQAAPLSQKCGGDGPNGWYCGVEARTHFRAWLRARSISCKVPEGFGDKPGEMETTCDLAGQDVGEWLVANGYAEAVPGGAYAEAERRAKAARLGIWAETRPAD